MADRLLPPGYQIFDANGDPVSGALCWTYEAGTSTPKITYSDGGGTVPNANPVVADSGGRFGNIFADYGDYRIVMQTSAGVTLFTADPVFSADSAGTIPGSGFRNLLVNADFSVDQRAATSIADDTYCLDCWYGLTQSANITIEAQKNQLIGIPTSIRLLQANATAQRMGLAQIVEAANCRYLKNADVVLSGRVRCSVAAPVQYAILAWTGTSDAVTSDVVLDWASGSYTAGGFFLGSSITVQAVGTITPAAGVWTDISTITSTLSTVCNNVIVFFWTAGVAAQNVTLDLADIQLEPGDTATAFEQLPRDTITYHCFRYYQKSFSATTAPAQNTEPATAASFFQPVGASTAFFGHQINLAAPLRTLVYTITLYNPGAANAQVRNSAASSDCTLSAAVISGTEKFLINATTPAGTTAGQRLFVHWTADASL